MELADLDRISGDVRVTVKGGRERMVRLSPKAFKLLKDYLKVRPSAANGRIWLTDDGEPLSYWGGQSLFRRLKGRTGIPNLHAHLVNLRTVVHRGFTAKVHHALT